MGMHSTGRIRVSHAGALPRPTDLARLFAAAPSGADAFRAALPAAVTEVVNQQIAALAHLARPHHRDEGEEPEKKDIGKPD